MPTRSAAILSLLLLALSACSRDEVRTYRVPKEKAMAAAPTTAPTAATAAGALTWTTPDHWTELPAGGMRRGSFTLHGPDDTTADLSIIAFPGDAGGLAANVNRWRGQIGLPALSDEDIQASVVHTDTASFHVDLVSIEGTAAGQPTRIDGAIFSYRGESWFVKLMGPTDLVAAEAPHFRAFVETLAPDNR